MSEYFLVQRFDAKTMFFCSEKYYNNVSATQNRGHDHRQLFIVGTPGWYQSLNQWLAHKRLI